MKRVRRSVPLSWRKRLSTQRSWTGFGTVVSTEGNYKLLEQAINKLRLDWSQPDAVSVVDKLRSQVIKALRDQGLSTLIEHDPKRLIGFIVPAIQPASFNQLVRDEMRDIGWRTVQQKSMVRFFQWLQELVGGYLRYRPAIETSDGKKATNTNQNQRGSEKPKDARPDKKPDAKKESTDGQSDRVRYACLKCKSTKHSVRNCPKVADGEAEKCCLRTLRAVAAQLRARPMRMQSRG